MDSSIKRLMLTYDRLRAVRLPVRCSMSSLMAGEPGRTVEQASAMDLASALAGMLEDVEGFGLFVSTRAAHSQLSSDDNALTPQTAIKALAVDAVRADILRHGALFVAAGLEVIEEEAEVAPGTFSSDPGALAARIRADTARLDAEELAAQRSLDAIHARREDLRGWEDTLRGVEHFREIIAR